MLSSLYLAFPAWPNSQTHAPGVYMFRTTSCSNPRILLSAHFAIPFLALALTAAPPAQAQDDQAPSVADAARAARANHGQQAATTAVTAHAPLSQVQLVAWQIAGVSMQDLLAQVKASGIAFAPDEQHLSPLKDAQLSADVLAALSTAQSHPDASADGVPQPIVAASQSFNAKDYAAARHALEPLAQQSKSADLYAALGNVLFQSHDLPAAKSAFESATQLDPSFVYAHVRLAGVYYSMQSADQTSTEAKKILKLQPDNAEARRYLSLSLSMRLQGGASGGSGGGGVEDMSDLANSGDMPQEAKDLNNQAIQMENEGDYKGAETAWNQALKASPNSALFYYSLANMYEKWGNHNALALSNFQRQSRLHRAIWRSGKISATTTARIMRTTTRSGNFRKF
jgi:tetratricopeptide (TPR) repeat protein